MIEGILNFIKELKIRNESLFYFGLFCLSLSIIFIVLTKFTTTQVHGVNAWFKPFKFAVSIGFFSWTMAWYCHYLSNFNPTPFNWTVIILFGFELAYIIFQASKGQLSHWNFDTPLYSILYSLMGLAARSEEHTSELQSQSTISYAVFCLKKKKEKKEKKKKKKHTDMAHK